MKKIILSFLIISTGMMMGREINPVLPSDLDSVDEEVIGICQGLVNEAPGSPISSFISENISDLLNPIYKSGMRSICYNYIGGNLIKLRYYNDAERILKCVIRKPNVSNIMQGNVHYNLAILYDVTEDCQKRDEHRIMAIEFGYNENPMNLGFSS